MRFCALFLVLTGVFRATGQDQRAVGVGGEVYDMLGKPIANAAVVYTDAEHGRTYRFLTDQNGKFHAVGVQRGLYLIQITSPSGEEVYSAEKYIYPENSQGLSVIKVDLSAIPSATALAPFKGPDAAGLQGQTWRNSTNGDTRKMTPQQLAEVRSENAAIATYSELAPQARAAIKKQDWSRASDLLQQLIAVAPYQWQLYQNSGIAFRSMQRNVEAIQALEKGIEVVVYDKELSKDRQKLNVAVARMMMLEGEAYNSLGRPVDAAAQYRRAAQIDPQPALAYILLCIAEYHSGNVDAASDACARSIAADPEQPEFYQIAAGIQSNLERFRDAIPIYEKGIRLYQRKLEADRLAHTVPVKPPLGNGSNVVATDVITGEENPDVKYRVGQMLLGEGNAYFQLKNYASASALFARAAIMHRYPALAYFNLCATRFDAGDLKAAVAACGRAIASDPRMADAYYVKAAGLAAEAARHKRLRSPEAAAALGQYLQLAPQGVYSSEARTLLQELSRGN